MCIYVDVIFLINFIMNSIILLLTAWASGIAYKRQRILFAAACGSFYMIGEFIVGLSAPYTALARCAASVMLVLLAFGRKKFSTLLLLTGIFYIVSFALGGAVIGWIYFWQTSGSLVWKELSWTDLAGGSVIGILVVTLLVRRMSARMYRRSTLYPIKISYEGRTADITAMLDTGNGLSTVLKRKPVVIVDYDKIKEILSQEVVSYLQTAKPDVWLTNLCECQDQAWLERIEIIPYHSVGRHSMLLGFRPDFLTVTIDKGIISTANIVVGIYNNKLCDDRTYAALLNPSVITEFNIKQEAKACIFLGQ